MLKKKKCKSCKEWFTPTQPLQMVCSPKCAIDYSKVLKEKKHKKERLEKLPELYPRKYRGLLQAEINKLARMIDIECNTPTCIDCGETLVGIGQVDAAHFFNSKNHGNIRYNLHNLHSARSNCNFYSDTHKEGYKQGLILRYGQEYFDMVEELPLEYADIKLSNQEVAEKLKLVRKIIRDFKTYKLIKGDKARSMFNKLIGIYNN